jgi:acetylornithine deacetylase/succinyl-diaminopimelate desuccinylase-like protein
MIMVSMDVEFFKKYFEENLSTIEKDYTEFLRFQTVSSDPTSLPHHCACANWLENRLKACGCTVEQWKGEISPPIVFASLRCSNPNAPTVLLYNHYDVQPVDPLKEWINNPFEARRENDIVYARGAQDNKGQCLYVLLALEALAKMQQLPCHIKYLIEGEEENGSASLTKIIKTKNKELAADFAMVIDAGMRNPELPAINLGTRGLVCLTVEIKGTTQDLHSGCEGGLAYNPLHAMASLLASLHHPDGSIAVPGFYDEVRMPSGDELSDLAITFNEKAWEHQFGQPPTGGETAFPPLVRNWLRPTLEINGIHGGYGGPGSKTVIPKEAIAKISCRLVPDQDPVATAKKVQSFILSSAPKGVTVTVTIHEGMGKATRASSSLPGIQALAKSLAQVWDKKPEFILDGASIPIISLLQEVSGGEVITWGVGLPTDHIHAPNERFDLARMERGFATLCVCLGLIGKIGR